MDEANKLELHYYFGDDSHDIDSALRNKCEAEILAIFSEVALILDIDARPYSEAYAKGGFREFWKLVGDNGTQITIALLVLQLILTTVPLLDNENKELEKRVHELTIEEKELTLKKLRKELGINPNNKTIEKVAKYAGQSLKITKRKSNLYSTLDQYEKIKKVGFSVLSDNGNNINEEQQVKNTSFQKFILNTNKLKSDEIENAEIEIISPVLKEGRYKWKGVYEEKTISFDMLDAAFQESVLLENLPFRHGTKILCALLINKELDEMGEIKIKGYQVTTVIEKIDGMSSIKTTQGKRYLQAKKFQKNQTELFA